MQQLPVEEDGIGTDEFLPHFQKTQASQIISKLKHAILLTQCMQLLAIPHSSIFSWVGTQTET